MEKVFLALAAWTEALRLFLNKLVPALVTWFLGRF